MSIDTDSSSTGETGTDTDCPAGGEGCSCEPGGTCAPGLECVDDVCQCPAGTEGCPCTPDGGCEPGLGCVGEVCEPSDPGCGNGILEDGEECDDGTGNGNNNACKSDCTNQICGDGFVGPAEACDDGNEIDDDACTNSCALPNCGDGVLHEGEECDDGNGIDTDACLNSCLVATCGDTVTWEGVEECDDGENGIETDACVGDCVAASCGDFIIWEGVEGCDDGNGTDFDGCNSDCAVTASIVWEDVFNGPVGTGCDTAFGLHVDDDDNVIAVGSVNKTADPLNDCDVLVRKYDTNGAVLWTDLFDSPSGACDEAWGVETDASGAIFVSGTVYNPSPLVLRDQWLRKYGPGGDEQWTLTLNGGDEDFSYGAAVDDNGDVVFVGATQTPTSGYDITVSKRDGSSGALIWSRSHNGASNLNDFGLDVEIRGTDIYVVGFETVGGQDQNAWVRKYDGNGGVEWTATHNGAQNGQDRAGGVAIDAAGGVIVVGFERGLTNHDMWVAKYDGSGDEQWSDIYNNPDLLWADRLQDVAVDSQDNIVVVGHEWAMGRAGNSFDLWMRKYTSAGEELWTQAENGPAGGEDIWYAVEIDSEDRPVVGGSVTVDGQCTNMLVRKYNR